MADSMHQPRDENGQFISIATLFERERQEHARDHERERNVAQATAERLEREVEETARRLERLVDETAVRLEKGVSTALDAVAKTAQVHSEAHNREHAAHERIHGVEKVALDKAEVQGRQEAERLAESLGEYKTAANEWRAALGDQSNKFISRELFDSQIDKIEARIQPLSEFVTGFQSSVSGKQISRTTLFGAVGALAAIIAIVVVLVNAWGGGG